MSPVLAQLLLGIAVSLIERGPEAFEAAKGFAEAVAALLTEGRDPTDEELEALMLRAFGAGGSLRSTVLQRLLPGGDWHGRVRLTPRISELLQIAQGRVSGA